MNTYPLKSILLLPELLFTYLREMFLMLSCGTYRSSNADTIYTPSTNFEMEFARDPTVCFKFQLEKT
jgi:hypothetical protein